jgi:K+-transporting ATPase c subunit
MKKLLFVLGISLMMCSLAIGQKSLRIDAKGNYFTEVKTKVADKLSGNTFTDALGIHYPLYITSANKVYYLKASSATGNIGKHYLKMATNVSADFWDKPYSIKI